MRVAGGVAAGLPSLAGRTRHRARVGAAAAVRRGRVRRVGGPRAARVDRRAAERATERVALVWLECHSGFCDLVGADQRTERAERSVGRRWCSARL